MTAARRTAHGRVARSGARRGKPLGHVDAFDHDVFARPVARTVSTAEIASTTSMPAVTWPKTVCLPSSQTAASVGDDEELAAVRVRAGVRHRERAAHDLWSLNSSSNW